MVKKPNDAHIPDPKGVDEARRRFLWQSVGLMAGLIGAGTLGGLATTLAPKRASRQIGRFDLSNLKGGQGATYLYQDVPYLVVHRTQEMLNALAQTEHLADPNSLESVQPAFAKNTHRSLTPPIFVARAVCTHLGCAPSFVGDGFFCPCHRSMFDAAGRVFKNQVAPTNLIVPNYQIESHWLILGEAL